MPRIKVDLGQVKGLVDLLSGNTPRSKVDNFIDNEFPQITNDMYRSDDPDEVVFKHGARLYSAAVKAGYGPQSIQKLFDTVVEPAARRINQKKLERKAAELRPQTQVTDTPTRAPKGLSDLIEKYGGGSDLSLPFSVETKAGRAFDQSDALELAAIESQLGRQINPSLLTVPSQVNQNEAQAGHGRALEAAANALTDHRRGDERRAEQKAESQRRALRNMQGVTGRQGLALSDAATVHPSVVENFIDVEDPLLEDKRSELKARTDRSRAQAERARRVPGGNADMLTPAAITSRLNAIDRTLSDPLLEDEDREELVAEAKALRTELLRRTQSGTAAAESGTGAPRSAMNTLPDPKRNKNRIIRDTETGERFQSNGTRWVKISGGPAAIAGEY